MKFLHAADLHLDSPLRGLDSYPGAPIEEIRGATRKALENLVALALDEKVDFVILAGDLFDGDWPDFNTGLFFVQQIALLGKSKIPVFGIRGNHDAESKITKKLPWPENVRFFSHKHPESIVIEKDNVVIHGQSYPTQKVTDDLAVNYPAAILGKINIGVLHTSLTGRPGHANYAPTTLDILKSKGYDYWALGHVHNREVVSSNPLIVFPGNTQGRYIKETGTKGCELVILQGSELKNEHRPLHVLRWENMVIDISGAKDFEEVLSRFAFELLNVVEAGGGMLTAVRVRFIGRGDVYKSIASKPDSLREQVRAIAIRSWR